MRITKKFAGANCIGKQVFQPSEDYFSSPVVVETIKSELRELENKFVQRLFRKSASSVSLVDDCERAYSGGGASDDSSSLLAAARPLARQHRYVSAPDLTELISIRRKAMHSRNGENSSPKRRRTLSLMDLDHYADNDDAAGFYA
jgi:hypothetical protein